MEATLHIYSCSVWCMAVMRWGFAVPPCNLTVSNALQEARKQAVQEEIQEASSAGGYMRLKKQAEQEEGTTW